MHPNVGHGLPLFRLPDHMHRRRVEAVHDSGCPNART
jgi:hypothetical protein